MRDGDASGKRVALSLQAGSPSLMSRSLSGEMMPNEPSKAVDGYGSGERPAITSPLSLVKLEEHQQHNINSESLLLDYQHKMHCKACWREASAEEALGFLVGRWVRWQNFECS